MNARLGGRPVAVLLHEPSVVVAVLEGDEREAQVLDRGEGLDPEDLLLQGADEALGDTVALGLGDERRARPDAEEAELVLEGSAHVLAAVVVSQREAGGDATVVAAEVVADGLPQGFQGLEAGATPGRVQADALAGAVVDGEEDVKDRPT